MAGAYIDAQKEVRNAMQAELLRAEEVAEVLGIGRSKVFEMLRTGELPVVRMGRAVRVPKGALAKWIESRTVGDVKHVNQLSSRRWILG